MHQYLAEHYVALFGYSSCRRSLQEQWRRTARWPNENYPGEQLGDSPSSSTLRRLPATSRWHAGTSESRGTRATAGCGDRGTALRAADL